MKQACCLLLVLVLLVSASAACSAAPAPSPCFPENGEVFIAPDYDGSCELRVIDDTETNMYVYLQYLGESESSVSPRVLAEDAEAPYESDLAFYVKAGKQVTKKVPVGIYKFYYATGTEFYGKEELFGDATDYRSLDEPLDFRILEEPYAVRYTVKFRMSTPQDFMTSAVPREEFPDSGPSARAEAPAGGDYGPIRGDLSGLTPEIAGAYLAVVDELAAHFGYDEAEAAEGEYLHGGFIRDWDGDGTPELCLLLKTSPREPEGWDGTPIYGWNPPTLCLYTYQDGQAVRAGGCDLYFATAGREAAVALLMSGVGLRYLRWDRSMFEEQSYMSCFELLNGAVEKTDLPAEAAAASEGAETAQAFLDALGADRAQLLLYNSSGEAEIEGEANARELRAALAAAAS